MAEKRKISVRKIMQFVVTLIVTAGCIVAISSASKIESGKFVNNIQIKIKNENKCRFINKESVLNMLVNDRHVDIKHIPVSHLDLHGMEQIVSANAWVGNAEIYVDNTHNLHINVTQRVPVARVFEEDGNSYYLDTALKAMPLSDKYIYYTTVVTNVPVIKDDSIGKSISAQVVHLVRFIERDTFWNAQVSQIIMTPERTFELVPVLGHQRILIGDTSMLPEKFGNLFAFYKSVSNRIGWDKYEVIDVRYKGQVVASPSLPWNAPVDKVMSSMNWVKSIVGTDTAKTITASPVTRPQFTALPAAAPLPKKPEEKVVAKPAQPVARQSVPPPTVLPAASVRKLEPKVEKVVAKPLGKPAQPAVKASVPPPTVLPAANAKKPEPKVVVKPVVKPAAKAPVNIPVKTAAKAPPRESAPKALPASARPKPKEAVNDKVAAKPASAFIGPPKPVDADEKPAAKTQTLDPAPKTIMPAAAKEVKAVPKKAPAKAEKKEVKKDVKAKKPNPKAAVKNEGAKKPPITNKQKDNNKNH